MYSTGTATDVSNLLDQLVTFCEANGWTRDSYASESTGNRWHAHRGSVYVNFRSFISETLNSEISGRGTLTTGLAFNVGTGYSGAVNWYKQAGVPTFSAASYFTAGFSAISTVTAYHFFASNSGDQIYVVIESTSGRYHYLGFGSGIKYGTYTGGVFMFGSGKGVSATTERGLGFYQPTYSSSSEPSGTMVSSAFFTVDVDSETGWHVAQPIGESTARRKLVDLFHPSMLYGIYSQPNTLNGVAVLQPVIPMIFRSTTGGASDNATPLGEIPKIFYCHIQSLVPAQQIILGSTNYRVFPFVQKGTSVTDIGTNSGYFGFAIAE